MRLDKFICSCTAYTRSQAKKLIHSKRVSLAGCVVTDEGFKVDEDCPDITLDGVSLKAEKYIYIMLNKPAGVISATEDARHKTVIDLLGGEYSNKGLFPVGRLDIDTEGLLILTDNGDFAHNTLSPKKHVEKTYIARVGGYTYTEESKQRFADGILLDDGYKCLPAKTELISACAEYAEIKITISEGKFHQIKKMFAAEGGKVEYLKRISFGEITLDENLKSGEYRLFDPDEKEYAARRTK
ncbi:MAG: rRNA pseudouridine synthase [Firmicutes bacterium]|nr:rRNA pseudouridine synthase [Bacillota bacterium]